MLLYGWRASSHPNNSIGFFLKEFWKAEDVIFNRKDPFPLLAQPLLMFKIWLSSLRSGLSLPAFFMCDAEWNGEEV